MKFSPEFMRKERSECIERMFVKANDLLDKNRLDPSGFVDIYGEGVVNSDLAIVGELNSKFEKEMASDPVSAEHKKLATILEALVFFHGEQNEWFGDGSQTIAPSRYDDVINKVDILVNVSLQPGQLSILGMAIDTTTTQNLEFVNNKIEAIKEEIKAGRLAEVKYFEDPDATFKGALKKVPHVLIDLDTKTVLELAELWDEGDNTSLASHPVQLNILYQIIKQSEVFALFARKNGQEEIASIYETLRGKITSILENKLTKINKNILSDRAHDFLMELFEELNKDLER